MSALRERLGPDFGPVRTVDLPGDKTTQHERQQVMEVHGPNAVDAPPDLLAAVAWTTAGRLATSCRRAASRSGTAGTAARPPAARGGARGPQWSQLLADVTGLPVEVLEERYGQYLALVESQLSR